MTVPNFVKRIARTRPAQRLLTRPRPARVAQALVEATTVTHPFRFVWRELSGSSRLARYGRRGSGRPVFVRHNTDDPRGLNEIFYWGHYELPERAADVLDGLGRPPRVLDLGANIGLFGVWVLDRFPGAQIVAFEPDPGNAALARLCVEANGAGHAWRLVEAAASNSGGRLSFLTGEFLRSRINPGEGAVEVDAVDVFPYLDVDFAKIDIEGGEWAILGDPRWEAVRVPVIVLEYHDDLAPGENPRDLAIEALRRAGYEVKQTEEFSGGQGILWAWRPA